MYGSAEAEVQAVIPLCTYLMRTEGKDAQEIMPRLLHCLHRLPNCSASSKGPARWQTMLSTLFSSLYKVMCLQHFPETGRKDISQAIKQLLVLAVEGPFLTESGSETSPDLLAGLRGAVSLPHDSSAFLPLLPDDASALVASLMGEHMAPDRLRDGMTESSNQLVVLLLAAQLCKSASKGHNINSSLAHQIASVASSWLKDMMRPVTSSIDGAESSSEDGLARPAPLPSRQMVAGASYLACTLSAQAAHSRRVHTALGEHDEFEAQLNSVVELMLDITESSVAFCWELGSGEAAAGQVMTLASAAIKEAQVAFAACVSAQPVMLPDLVSRIRSLLLSSARLTEGELLRHTDDIGPATAQTAPDRVWRWDLTTDAVPVGTGPGAHAQQLCRAVSEAACSLLAASWQSGDQAGVKAAFLPLSDIEGFSALASTANERQAVLLTVGRLCCVLHGSKSHRHSAASEELARMALTLLLDTLGSEDASLSQVDACAVYTLACLGVSYGLQDCRWAYEQVAEALSKLYKDPEGRVGQHLLYGSPRAGCPGLLADALLDLAQGLAEAHIDIRQDLQMRLLSLFVDFALNPLEGKQVWDLGALLPAIASLSQGLPATHAIGKKKTHSNSFDILQVIQEDDANRIKMFRLLWLYSALYNLTGIGARGPKYPFPEPWRLGLGQIALASPFAVVGGGSETTEKLEAEFGERLLRLGPKATASTLAALLAETVSGSATVAHPSTAARTAHVLIIAALNLVRVEVAPLPCPHDLPPLAFLLAQQQVSGSDSADGPWLKAITERVMNIYCERLSGFAWCSQVDDTSRITPCIDNLAQVLVENLTGRSGNPDLALLADRLLHSMLVRFPQLLWSSPVMQALLVELQREEGALYLSGAKPRLTLARVLRIRKKKKKVPLPAWTWIIRIVQEGAALAPGWTEAMFHELLDQEASPASGAALHHAADIMSLHDTAKAQHCMAGMQQTISGVQALNRKARYRGIVAGCQTLDEAKDFPSAVGGLTQIAAALQHAIASKAPAKILQDRYLQATAALIQQSGSSMQPKLLHLIAWLPAHRFGTFSMSLAVFAWHWIFAESPDLQVPLMSEIVQAWLYTSDNNMGIFDCHFDAKAFIEGTLTDAEAAAHCDDNASSASPAAYGDMLVPISQVDDITAHHIWVGFFLQTWQVMSYGASAESAAITTIFTRMLQHSLKDSHGLSQHPAATGTRFRLLLLALQHCRQTQQHQRYQHGQVCPPHIAVLFERIMATALQAFRAPPAWYGKWHKNQAREQAVAVSDFRQEVQNMPSWPTLPRNTSASGGPALIHPVWGTSTADNRQRQELLLLLLRSEAERLTVWASPRDVLDADNRIHLSQTSDQDWGRHLLTAWDCDQRLALCLLERYPAISAVRRELEALVLQHADDPALQELPEAALLLATPGAVSRNAPQLTNLAVWAVCPLLQAMALMAGQAGAQPAVRAYCIRSLQATKPEEVAFFLPQLVQLLRGDSNGMIQRFLFTAAGRSNVFAYNLVCILKSEATPGEDEMNPTVKRSGWHAPEDTGLWAIADRVAAEVWEHLPNDRELFLKAEQAFFDEVTQVSGKLFPFPKDERKAQAVKILKGIHVPRKDLYLPTNPESRVMSLIPESGQPMQSAAKVPLLVKFKVEESLGPGRSPETRLQACIFKVGDDCRQDVLALQVIGLLKDAFQKAGLDLYLAPYGVLPTAYECGIIEVVPEASSRSALGETSDAGLYEIFQREFGAPGTESFEIARHNFILSSAGYAIASYLLQSKDRHNGNILIDTQGRLVHIDFGFILEISPGANMRFESAAFKLSHEMTQLLDPSGQRDSSQFHLFEELCVRGFLAARSVAEGIMATVALMQESRLPCFGRGAPIPNLRKRFHLDMTEAKAAAFMRSTILDAYDKWTTGVYDFIQYMQNAIPK